MGAQANSKAFFEFEKTGIELHRLTPRDGKILDTGNKS
jgi:hypothetical protein